MKTEEEKSFEINGNFGGPLTRLLFSLVRSPLERVLSLRTLGRMYAEVATNNDQREFLYKGLDALKISYEVSQRQLERIPKTGPIIVVANHPFGGIEGMVLAAILKQVRPDIKIMANFILERIKETRHLFIFVDPFGLPDSHRKNIQPMRETVDWLIQDGLVGIFPAGEVSHLHWSEWEVRDPVWSNTVARIIRKTKVPVLPIFFEGCNGRLFQLMGLIHPRLRTVMLPYEFLNKRNTTLTVRVGNVIPYDKLATFETDEDMMSYLRLRTYLLDRSLASTAKREEKKLLALVRPKTAEEPIIPAGDPQVLEQELAALPEEQRLVEHDGITCYYTLAHQIPNVMKEIGRLREITFRKVGEGSGKSLDLDEFDRYYFQLFLWHEERREIIGAYRIGKTDEILSRYGPKGLYTSTLFAYKGRLLEQLSPALELGRSFVREEHQKGYSSLLLLWKGIGKFVGLHPKYRFLFGVVSISNHYDSMSKQLIADFLRSNRFLPELAKFIIPRNPLRHRPLGGLDSANSSKVVRDIEDVASIVEEIEADQRGIPVLLRQYLKLGGKLLGFNVDPEFGDCLDGLILVDLMQTERRILDRFMGKEIAQKVLDYHTQASVNANFTSSYNKLVNFV